MAREYRSVVAQSLGGVLAESPELSLPRIPSQSATLVVMTSEQPLCGPFNQNVLALAEQRCMQLRQEGNVHLIVVGQRGTRLLQSRGMRPDALESAALSVEGLRDTVKRLARLIGQQLTAGGMAKLGVVYNRYQSVTEQVPAEEWILPPDLDRLRQPATAASARRLQHYLSPAALLAGLIQEYAFISLYCLAADSFASEQASRLVAMDGATRNTDHMLRDLEDLERRERQDEITRQVLEQISARFAVE
jgi:F-type H+-transporting ATPase subunit gamma